MVHKHNSQSPLTYIVFGIYRFSTFGAQRGATVLCNMDQEKKKRKVLLTLLTKKVNEVEVIQRKGSALEFATLLTQLEEIGQQVNLCNEKIQEVLLESDVSEEILTEELTNSQDYKDCLLYTSPSPRDLSTSRMPSSA